MFSNVRLPTTHTPSAKEPTQNCYSSYSSIPFGEASFPDRSKNYIKHLHKADLKNNVVIMMLILWVYLQCRRNRKESSLDS